MRRSSPSPICALALAAFVVAPICAPVGVSALVAGVAHAAPPQRSFEELREQGLVYHRKDMFKRALAVLDQAAATPEGKGDFETALHQASSAYHLLMLERAYEAIERAQRFARTDDERAEVGALSSEMRARYGAVILTAADPEAPNSGRIAFESQTGIINKVKRERFEAIRERFRSTDVQLPRTVYLPYGQYKANKVPFEIVEGQPPSEVQIYLQAPKGDDDEDDDDSLVWWVAGGAVAAATVGTVLFFALAEDEKPPRILLEDASPNR